MTDDRGGGGSSLPYILIGLGLLILLLNLGWFGDLVGGIGSLLSLWPLALIAVGADLVTNGRYRLIIVVAAIVVGLLLLASWRRPGGAGASGEVQDVDLALDGASRIELNLDSGLAELNLGSAAIGATALSGQIVPVRGERVTVESRHSAGTLDIRVTARSERGPFGIFGLIGGPGSDQGDWDLTLSEGVPVDVYIDSGVGDIDLDLSRVDLRNLEIDAGVGSTTVALPGDGGFEADIDGGVGSITLLLPGGAPARIDVDGGLGNIDVDESFARDGDSYTSANYREGGGARISIDAGIGQVRVETVP